MKNKIVVIGSSNVDLIMKMNRLPEKGETITDADFFQVYGGKGANQAVGAVRAGGNVAFVNCVGDDAYTPEMLENFRKDGIDIRFVFQETGIASGHALVMIGGEGNNYLSVSPGANYAPNLEIINGVYPAISDSHEGAKPDASIMTYLSRNLGLGLKEYDTLSFEGKTDDIRNSVMMVFPNSASMAEPRKVKRSEDQIIRSFFDQTGVLITRPLSGSSCNLGVAFKGENNAESHNHNDVGSFTIVLGNEIMVGDPGAIPYTANIFDPQYRYTYKTVGSFGHPVPLVAGKEQQPGAGARAKTVRTDFTREKDEMTLDNASAYDLPELKKLERGMSYNRTGRGSVTVSDEFEYSQPEAFETAISTRAKWKKIINEPLDGTNVSLSLINQDNFDTVKTVTSSIVVGKKGIGTDTITFSIIGDSFTQGAFFKDALLVKGYVPKIKMVGLRDVSGYSGQFDEGRGGWTLAKYFKVSNQKLDVYNGLFQPVGNFKYWGSTDFWKLAIAIRNNPKADWSFGESYNAGRFSTRSQLFDEKTGYRVSPEKDDIMYDNSLESYVQFTGKKWIKVNSSDFIWDVDYGKYLSIWKLDKPAILTEFLGLNDFRGAKNPAEIDFSKWNEQIEKLATSYLKAVPNGKFVLMIPSSTCGILDNEAGDFTTKQNASMWEHRRNIIEHFDGRESENIYIVDAAIAIDNVDGFNFLVDPVFTRPYSEYQGTEMIQIQKGTPHPYPNYPNMGISLAAFIQKYR